MRLKEHIENFEILQQTLLAVTIGVTHILLASTSISILVQYYLSLSLHDV